MAVACGLIRMTWSELLPQDIGMPHTNVEIIKNVYKALEQGDLSAIISDLAPSIEIKQSSEMPGGRRLRGSKRSQTVFESVMYVAAFAPDQGAANPTPGTKDLAPDVWGFTTLSPEVVQTDFAQDFSETEKRVLTAARADLSRGSGRESNGNSVGEQAVLVHHCGERPDDFTGFGTRGSKQDKGCFDYSRLKPRAHAHSSIPGRGFY